MECCIFLTGLYTCPGRRRSSTDKYASLLNPNTTGQTPQSTFTSQGSGSRGLSTAAAAGVGSTLGVVLLGGSLATAFYIRGKRRRNFDRLGDGYSGRRFPRKLPPRYELDIKAAREGVASEREARSQEVFEIYQPAMPPSPFEIDGIETRRISVTIEGTPPRHLGFQARY
jgi:hypothetical protein